MRAVTFVVGIALAATAGATPRTGRVVRIERKPEGIGGLPRFCTITTSDLSGYCLGPKAPEAGERVTVLDTRHVLGTLRIVSVTAVPDACKQSGVWNIQGALDAGDLSSPQGQTVGVLDIRLDPRQGKLLSIDRSPAGHPWGTDQIVAIDSDGDGRPELEFVMFPCDDAGNLTPNPRQQCLEVWADPRGRGLRRIRADQIEACH